MEAAGEHQLSKCDDSNQTPLSNPGAVGSNPSRGDNAVCMPKNTNDDASQNHPPSHQCDERNCCQGQRQAGDGASHSCDRGTQCCSSSGGGFGRPPSFMSMYPPPPPPPPPPPHVLPWLQYAHSVASGGFNPFQQNGCPTHPGQVGAPPTNQCQNCSGDKQWVHPGVLSLIGLWEYLASMQQFSPYPYWNGQFDSQPCACSCSHRNHSDGDVNGNASHADQSRADHQSPPNQCHDSSPCRCSNSNQQSQLEMPPQYGVPQQANMFPPFRCGHHGHHHHPQSVNPANYCQPSSPSSTCCQHSRKRDHQTRHSAPPGASVFESFNNCEPPPHAQAHFAPMPFPHCAPPAPPPPPPPPPPLPPNLHNSNNAQPDQCQCCRKPPVARYFPASCSWVPSKFEYGPSPYSGGYHHACQHNLPPRETPHFWPPAQNFNGCGDNYGRSQYTAQPHEGFCASVPNHHSMHQNHSAYHNYKDNEVAQPYQRPTVNEPNPCVNVNERKQVFQNNSESYSPPSVANLQKTFNSLHSERQNYVNSLPKPGKKNSSKNSDRLFVKNGANGMKKAEKSLTTDLQEGKNQASLNCQVHTTFQTKEESVCKTETKSESRILTSNSNQTDSTSDRESREELQIVTETVVRKEVQRSSVHLYVSGEADKLPSAELVKTADEVVEAIDQSGVNNAIDQGGVEMDDTVSRSDVQADQPQVDTKPVGTVPVSAELIGATCKELTPVDHSPVSRPNSPSCPTEIVDQMLPVSVVESETNIIQRSGGLKGAINTATPSREELTQDRRNLVQNVELLNVEKEPIIEDSIDSGRTPDSLEDKTKPVVSEVELPKAENSHANEAVTVEKRSAECVKSIAQVEDQPIYTHDKEQSQASVINCAIINPSQDVNVASLPVEGDCHQSVATKNPDSKSDTDDAHEDAHKEPLSNVTGDEIEKKLYESKVTQVHLSNSEEESNSADNDKNLAECEASCHATSEVEEATCNLSLADNAQVASGTIDITVASVSSPKKSAPSPPPPVVASAKKISIGAMCKEITHKLVAEVVLEETTEVITKQAPSLLSGGKDDNIDVCDGDVEIATGAKEVPADDLVVVPSGNSGPEASCSQDKLSEQPIVVKREQNANEPLQAVVFENCVKVSLASAPESLPIQDILPLPAATNDSATAPSHEESSPSQSADDAVKETPQVDVKVEPLLDHDEDAEADVHGSNESLSASGAAASPKSEESPLSAVANDDEEKLKEEQFMFVCDGEIHAEQPAQTVYLSGTDITLTPSSSSPETESDTSESKNRKDEKYRSSWYSEKRNEKTVSRTNRMYIDRAKVGTLRYLILQSPLVMCDVDITDDEESDVELDENGEVIQDYPLGYLPTFIVEQIFSHLCTRDLAALKCACKDFKWLIERFNITGTDSRWLESDGYRDDPCYQCGKIRDARGDVSLCRWHPKIYYKNGHIGRRYWTCCFTLEEDAIGCQVGVHDNNWVLSGFKIRKVPRPWRSMYWRSFSVSDMWW